MTREEAIVHMEQGVKITHRFFSPDEWVTMHNGYILSETGRIIDNELFWEYRTGRNWQTGYSIFNS